MKKRITSLHIRPPIIAAPQLPAQPNTVEFMWRSFSKVELYVRDAVREWHYQVLQFTSISNLRRYDYSGHADIFVFEKDDTNYDDNHLTRGYRRWFYQSRDRTDTPICGSVINTEEYVFNDTQTMERFSTDYGGHGHLVITCVHDDGHQTTIL